MYLHIGNNKIMHTGEIVGIFDLDSATMSHITRKYLSEKTKAGKVISASEEVPKSFLVTRNGQVYISQISPQALRGRIREDL